MSSWRKNPFLVRRFEVKLHREGAVNEDVRVSIFEHTSPKNHHAVKLASDIQSAFATVFDKIDRVDLVKDAGYSRHCEGLSDGQIGTQKEVNSFGLINVTRMAVEAMKRCINTRSRSPIGKYYVTRPRVGDKSLCRLFSATPRNIYIF